jgi:hypothetical protein
MQGYLTMNTEAQLFKKYQTAGVKRGEECLLRHADALRFLADCERLGITILGMDFYRQEGMDVIELLETADYSSLSGQEDAVGRSVAAARRLIQAHLPDGATWVSFTVEKQGTKSSRKG